MVNRDFGNCGGVERQGKLIETKFGEEVEINLYILRTLYIS